MKRIVFHVIIPILIISAAVFGAVQIVKHAQKPERKDADEIAPVVELMTVEPQPMTMQVTATGSVVPARQITLTPEVTGRVVKLSPELAPGTLFKKGDIIARIDRRDYALAITQEEGRVHQAELELQLEKGRVEIAERELQVLGRDKAPGAAVSSLARRTPHLEVAKQNTASARSGLSRAKLNLSRTVIRAPFNAIVLEKRVDVGQLVGPSTPIATLMGSDELWINLSVPVEKLTHIQIPGVNAEQGSRVEVYHRIGPGQSITRVGQVIRLEGRLDDQNRTATVLASIKRPFEKQGQELPLLSGAYVTARIDCQGTVAGVNLPRRALVDGRFVWRVDQELRIKKQALEIGWRNRDQVVAIGGLSAGDRIVAAPLARPIKGMKVRPFETPVAADLSAKQSNSAAGGTR